MLIVSQALLVILTGIYAIRASWFLFSPGQISPLTPVAATVFVLCPFLFHRLPIAGGGWHYTLLAICLIGAIANGSLLFSTSPVYTNPTNMLFSAVSLGCFVLLGLTQLLGVYRPG